MKPQYHSIPVIRNISLGALREGTSDEFITSGAAEMICVEEQGGDSSVAAVGTELKR